MINRILGRLVCAWKALTISNFIFVGFTANEETNTVSSFLIRRTDYTHNVEVEVLQHAIMVMRED